MTDPPATYHFILTRNIFIFGLCLFGQCSVDSFPLPSYQSTWHRIRVGSKSAAGSVAEFSHGLGRHPLMVKVYVRPFRGPNQGFIFEAMTSAQRDDDDTPGFTNDELKFGAVIYEYNHEKIFVFAPVMVPNGFVFCVGNPGWSGGNLSQCETEAYVSAMAWGPDKFPAPDFDSGWFQFDAMNGIQSYRKIRHGIGEMPSLITAQTRARKIGRRAQIMRLYADGMGATATSVFYSSQHYGGMLVGCSNDSVQLWAPTYGAESLLFSAGDGWANNALTNTFTLGEARVQLWRNLTGLLETAVHGSQGSDFPINPVEIRLSTPITSGMILDFKIKALDGPNKDFVFNGFGSAFSMGPNTSDYGGVIYGFRDNIVRVFRPIKQHGHVVYIGEQWGNGTNHQKSNKAQAVIRVWRLVDPPVTTTGMSTTSSSRIVGTSQSTLGANLSFTQTSDTTDSVRTTSTHVSTNTNSVSTVGSTTSVGTNTTRTSVTIETSSTHVPSTTTFGPPMVSLTSARSISPTYLTQTIDTTKIVRTTPTVASSNSISVSETFSTKRSTSRASVSVNTPSNPASLTTIHPSSALRFTIAGIGSPTKDKHLTQTSSTANITHTPSVVGPNKNSSFAASPTTKLRENMTKTGLIADTSLNPVSSTNIPPVVQLTSALLVTPGTDKIDNTEENVKSSGTEPPLWPIILGVVASAVSLLILVVSLYCYCKSRSKYKTRVADNSQEPKQLPPHPTMNSAPVNVKIAMW